MMKSAKTMMLLAAAFTAGAAGLFWSGNNPERKVRSVYGGSSYHREAVDPNELRRSRTAYSETMRGGRLLLLVGGKVQDVQFYS